jgi:hypothetical protein
VEVDSLVEAIMEWAGEVLAQKWGETRKQREEEAGSGVALLLESKL